MDYTEIKGFCTETPLVLGDEKINNLLVSDTISIFGAKRKISKIVFIEVIKRIDIFCDTDRVVTFSVYNFSSILW